MNFRILQALCLALLSFGASHVSAADSHARLYKILPHYLDSQNRHTLHPSLFERDAYQTYLRAHLDQCTGIRFDVHYKSKPTSNHPPHQIQIEARLSGQTDTLVFRNPLKPSRFGRSWISIPLTSPHYHPGSKLIAWRVSLWEDQTLLAEQASFLW